MELKRNNSIFGTMPKLGDWSRPAKVLATTIILMMAIGLCVAVGQIIVHDIIPTFWNKLEYSEMGNKSTEKHMIIRGDLFADVALEKKLLTFYQRKEFLFALKFTHIHVFGMSAIFIVMGTLVLFLDLSSKARIWLIVLPFIGIIVDLASVWLKLFVHPAFFWLHIPGGALFGIVFGIDGFLRLWQIWTSPSAKQA